MASHIIYHLGGFIPAAAAQGRAEQWDSTTGYTRWNADGAQQEQRPLTVDEAARLAAQDAATAADVNQRDMRAKLNTALGVNDAYQALASPTAAQNLAQSRALTRECNALIRMQLALLDTTAGT